MGLEKLRKKPAALIAAATILLLILLAVAAKSLLRPPIAYKFSPGERLVFDVDSMALAEVDISALSANGTPSKAPEKDSLPPMAQSFHVHVRAQLAMSVLDTKDNRLTVSYRFINPVFELDMNGSDTPDLAEALSQSLNGMILSSMDPRGRILSVFFDPRMSRPAQNFAKSLLARIQFVFPDRAVSAKTRSWEVQEDDPNGEYTAHYESIDRPRGPGSPKESSERRTFRKTRRNYVLPDTGQRPSGQTTKGTIVPSGSFDALFDVRAGFLERLTGSETDSVFIGDRKVSQSDTSMQLVLQRAETLRPLELAELLTQGEERRATVKPVPLSGSLSQEEADRLLELSTLGRETIGSLLAELGQSDARGDKRNSSLYLKFRALANLHPETCETLGQHLIEAPPKSLTRRILMDALGSAKCPEAQAALVNVIRSMSMDASLQAEILAKLAMTDQPTLLAENTLRDLAAQGPDRSTFGNAIVGLGTMAYKLRDRDPSRARKIVDWITAQIEPSTPEPVVKLLLMSLGNSGSVGALPTLAEYLGNPSTNLRSIATAGLRWIEDDRVDELLAGMLKSDPESSVRANAVFALGFRRPIPLTTDAQKAALARDSSALVRLSVLENFWKIRQELPDFNQLLKQTAESDASADVRKAASDMLAKSSQKIPTK